jgi:hypothetical protein
MPTMNLQSPLPEAQGDSIFICASVLLIGMSHNTQSNHSNIMTARQSAGPSPIGSRVIFSHAQHARFTRSPDLYGLFVTSNDAMAYRIGLDCRSSDTTSLCARPN